MFELPFLALLKEIILVTFFLTFCGVIWWCYLRNGNEELERHRFAVLEPGNCSGGRSGDLEEQNG